MRLRRYLLKQKELIPKQGNLILTNEYLKNIGLKSLIDIKDKNKKLKKIKNNFSKEKILKYNGLHEIELKHRINHISKQIEQLTSLVNKTNIKLSKIEKKLI